MGREKDERSPRHDREATCVITPQFTGAAQTVTISATFHRVLWNCWLGVNGGNTKLCDAMYRVEIGMNYKDISTDNMRAVTLIATTVTGAIKRVEPLERGEYVAQVILIKRAD
mgnify:CR=1 FL=1